MHMADALISPPVGAAMWAVSAATIAYSSAKIRKGLDDHVTPLMGVLGAFLFAAQMINFSIPATGSSGHLGGGLLLAILLGPHAAFLTLASVLVVQALFFADGGILALGCNIFNIGFIPAFIVYPLVYKQLIGTAQNSTRQKTAIILSAMIALQLGPLCVVLETCLSGISALPFSTFLLFMQPIHLAIGIVEGIITLAIVSFVRKARPEILLDALAARPVDPHPVKKLVLAFLAAAIITGGLVSWFASENPDGLEWAIAKVTGQEALQGATGIHTALATLQEKSALLPDYSIKAKTAAAPTDPYGRWGTTASGLLGVLLTLSGITLSGIALRKTAALSRKPLPSGEYGSGR
ncbi:MAG: energy-coupling factor ABC transporter permease [Trichlorobacter sp.]|jgi:cobalt/nickel transport system permease protein